MRLSLKQKQVLGVTAMVAMIVIALSLLHLINTAGVLLRREPRPRRAVRQRRLLAGARAPSPIAGNGLQRRPRTSRSVQAALRIGALLRGRRRCADRRSDRQRDCVERSGAGREDRAARGRS